MFTAVRIKLTAWYMVIIMIITAFFTVAIFQVLSREVFRYTNLQEQRWELSQNSQSDGRMSPRYLRVLVPQPDPELEQELLSRIKFLLLVINVAVLFGSGVVSYLLAGKTLQPIEVIMEDQQRFISDAGHELKTPVAAVRIGIEVALRDKNLSLKEAKEVLQASLEEVYVLQAMTHSLLSLCQGERPQDEFMQEVSMVKVIQKAVKKMKLLAKDKHISITASLQPVFLRGNESQLVELFVILIDNAIKYSLQDTTISIDFMLHRRSLEVSIKDQGMGIAPEHINRIFDRFYRVEQSRNREDGGHGLGLAIAERIVQAHRGKITVKSTQGKGSVFLVHFPR